MKWQKISYEVQCQHEQSLIVRELTIYYSKQEHININISMKRSWKSSSWPPTVTIWFKHKNSNSNAKIYPGLQKIGKIEGWELIDPPLSSHLPMGILEVYLICCV